MTALQLSEAALSLSFDIFQRYAAVAELIVRALGESRAEPARVLDIGSGDTDFLSRFLPPDRFDIYYLDQGMSPARAADPHFLQGDACALPFPDGAFEIVCSVDLMEHLPPEARVKAAEEMKRVATGPIVVACPTADDAVEHYEALTNAAYRAAFGKDNKWLLEHLGLPLPTIAELVQMLGAARRRRYVRPNGYLPRWCEMIRFNLFLREVPQLRDFAQQVNRFYNDHLYPSDAREPCYRRVLLFCDQDDISLPQPPPVEESSHQEAYLRETLRLGYEMLGLTGEKDTGAAVGRALEAIGDLSGKSQAFGQRLLEVAREVGSYKDDQAKLAKLRETIATLRERVAGLEKLLAQSQVELARLTAELSRAREAEALSRAEVQRIGAEVAIAREAEALSRKELSAMRTSEERRLEEVQSLRGQLAAQERDVAELRKSLRRQATRMEKLLASRTYRAGRLLVAPLRLARNIVRGKPTPRPVSAAKKMTGRIVQFTPPDPDNPFYTLGLRELAKRGWQVQYCDKPLQIIEQLGSTRDCPAIVLFHQFDPYLSPGAGKTIRERADDLLDGMRRLRRAGASLVWTMHNATPHDGDQEEIEQELRLREYVARHFAGVVVLNEAGRQEARKFFRDGMIEVVPHPGFRGVYGPAIPREVTRDKMGYPHDAFIFGTLGAVRPYKGLELIIEAFQGLDSDNARLIIVGAARRQDYLDRLQARAKDDDRIAIRTGRTVPAADIPIWLGLMDIAVFGFKTILTSGSVILALSYGLPVIAPRLGGLPEVVILEQTGWLYEPNDVVSLRETMQTAMSDPLIAHMRYMAAPSLDEVAPEKVADKMEDAFTRILARR